MAARPGRVLIADEATFKITGEIALPKAAPGPSYPLQLSEDRKRFYSYSGNLEDIEIVDIAARKVVDTIRLSAGNQKVRFDGYDGGGDGGRVLILPVRAATKLVDRFEIGPKSLVEWDLAARKVGRTLPWPDGEERESVELRASPDGKLLYLFAEDVFVYDLSTLQVVDRWELSRSLEGRFGRVRFGSASDANDEPGFMTRLFVVEDPLQHRKVLGVTRLDLNRRKMDFWTLGPAQPVRKLALAPGGKTAYAILDEIGTYELWTVDLVARRLVKRTPFAGRPRMDMAVSSNGQVLYIFGAGNTIDLFDAATHRHLRTVTMDAEATEIHVFPPGR